MSECPPGVHSIFDPCPGNCTEPVSAREELRSVGVSADVIDYALAQHAHELAEKIRAEKIESPADETEEHVNYVIDNLADLIDPQKEGQ